MAIEVVVAAVAVEVKVEGSDIGVVNRGGITDMELPQPPPTTEVWW